MCIRDRSRIIIIHGVVILVKRHLRHGEKPDRLVAIAIVNVVRAARRRILKSTDVVTPEKRPAPLIPVRLRRFLPAINVHGDKAYRRRFERSIGYNYGLGAEVHREQLSYQSTEKQSETFSHASNGESIRGHAGAS